MLPFKNVAHVAGGGGQNRTEFVIWCLDFAYSLLGVLTNDHDAIVEYVKKEADRLSVRAFRTFIRINILNSFLVTYSTVFHLVNSILLIVVIVHYRVAAGIIWAKLLRVSYILNKSQFSSPFEPFQNF